VEKRIILTYCTGKKQRSEISYQEPEIHDWRVKGRCATISATSEEVSMSNLRLAIAALFVWAIVGAMAQQQKKFVLLPASELKAVTDRYPKSGPNRITGTWIPSGADIDGLEANLHGIAALSHKTGSNALQIEHPESAYRQYLGVLQAEQRRIYVNAFCGFNGDEPLPNWDIHLITIYDGGSCVWQALYDPSTKTFLELNVNGIG
jgi:hypothetical protein